MFATNFYGDSVGNVTATFVNAASNIRTAGNMFAANFYGDSVGNVTATFVNATGNITTTANVEVGNMISFGSHVQNNLLALRGNADPDASGTAVYCFGINVGNLKYQSSTINTSLHKFWTGTAQVAVINTNSGAPHVRVLPPDPSTQQSAMMRNDGADVYFLCGTAADPDGGWTTMRPLVYNLALGTSAMNGTTAFGANTAVASGRVMQFSSATQNCIINLYPGGETASSYTEYLGFGVNSFVKRIQVSTGSYNLFQSNTNQTLYLDYNGNAGWATTASMLYVSKNSSNRSINCAGTVNVSGADYAEYIPKAGNFEITKGAIVGINADGKITNRFDDSVTFAIKSTDPSFVGGDSWDREEVIGVEKPVVMSKERWVGDTDEEHNARMDAVAAWEAAHESARAGVDRVSFAGQVPCNVVGVVPGQYIVPCDPGDGSIAGRGVSVPTEGEYLDAVGKVIRIMDDGRAFVVVKVS